MHKRPFPRALKLTASFSSCSADDPPHDLVAAEGGGLVLHVEPQGDELVLDAVIVLLLGDLASGGVFDVARAEEHQRRFSQAARGSWKDEEELIRENCRDTKGDNN